MSTVLWIVGLAATGWFGFKLGQAQANKAWVEHKLDRMQEESYEFPE